MRRTIFIDVQGFLLEEDQFIVKELAILNENNRVTHLIFEPPFSDLALSEQQKININRSTQKHHGLCWNDGYVPYYLMEDLAKEILDGDDTAVVYVKGENKCKWLTKIFKNNDIKNIEYENFEYHNEENLSCSAHFGICALNHVIQMRNWWYSRAT